MCMGSNETCCTLCVVYKPLMCSNLGEKCMCGDREWLQLWKRFCGLWKTSLVETSIAVFCCNVDYSLVTHRELLMCPVFLPLL